MHKCDLDQNLINIDYVLLPKATDWPTDLLLIEAFPVYAKAPTIAISVAPATTAANAWVLDRPFNVL